MRTTPAANTVAGFILGTAELMKSGKQRGPGGYKSVAAFLWQHGRSFTPRPLPDDVRPGAARACFSNCADIATRWGEYTYCEGYAAGIIPVVHAWLADKDGFAVDPTWTGKRGRPAVGFEYFGVAIKLPFLMGHLLRDGNYSPVTDDFRHNYPIMTAPLADWKHPLNDPP